MTEVVGEEERAKDVLDAARSSMGQDISPIDLINIETFAKRVISMAEYRARLQARFQCCCGTLAHSWRPASGIWQPAQRTVHQAACFARARTTPSQGTSTQNRRLSCVRGDSRSAAGRTAGPACCGAVHTTNVGLRDAALCVSSRCTCTTRCTPLRQTCQRSSGRSLERVSSPTQVRTCALALHCLRQPGPPGLVAAQSCCLICAVLRPCQDSRV